jgi:hypothetical protein
MPIGAPRVRLCCYLPSPRARRARRGRAGERQTPEVTRGGPSPAATGPAPAEHRLRGSAVRGTPTQPQPGQQASRQAVRQAQTRAIHVPSQGSGQLPEGRGRRAPRTAIRQAGERDAGQAHGASLKDSGGWSLLQPKRDIQQGSPFHLIGLRIAVDKPGADSSGEAAPAPGTGSRTSPQSSL